MTTLTDAEYRTMLLAYARRTWPRLSPEEHEDLVQETYLKVCAAYPDRDRFLHRNLYLLTMRRIVIEWERVGHAAKHGGGQAPLSLDAPARGGGDPYESFLPARHDTAREALDNLALQGILDRMGDVGVRAIVSNALGYSWEAIQRQEGLARYSVYRRMLAAKRELKGLGYA